MVLVSDKPFPAGAMFESKARAYPSGAPLKCSLKGRPMGFLQVLH